MPSAAATLLAQIAALDARISDTTTAGMLSMGDGGTNATFNDIEKLIRARNMLQTQYDRITGAKPLMARGRVVGLPGGPVSRNYP